MQIFIDYEGNEIRLPDERRRHIRDGHPYVFRIPNAIELTLADPHRIEPSYNDSVEYWRYFESHYRWVIVVVIFRGTDAFIGTARTMVQR